MPIAVCSAPVGRVKAPGVALTTSGAVLLLTTMNSIVGPWG